MSNNPTRARSNNRTRWHHTWSIRTLTGWTVSITSRRSSRRSIQKLYTNKFYVYGLCPLFIS